MGRVSGGGSAAFTYDFGIAIAQSTVSKVTKLAGAALTLAGAFYALQTAGEKYVRTIKTTALAFGGYLNSMKAIEDAQNRINKGITTFSVDSQLQGIERLRQSGVNIQENFEFINKGAHAMGVEFSEFAGAISDGIAGNMSKLVEMGLLTQRAARYFQLYPPNTLMQQQRILSFVKQHKGLQSLIKQDFYTIQDQMTRIKTMWQDFLRRIVGRPNDPDSLYGQITKNLTMVADAFGNNMEYIKGIAFAVSRTLGWVVRQIGKTIMWLGRQAKKIIGETDHVFEKFQERTYAFIVWLEFWKVAIVRFFRDYSDEIKLAMKLAKLLLEIWAFNKVLKGFKLLRIAFAGLGGKIIAPFKMFSRYMKLFGRSWRSFTVAVGSFMPKSLRGFWVGMVNLFGKLGDTIKAIRSAGFVRGLTLYFPKLGSFAGKTGSFFKNIVPFLKNLVPFALRLIKNLPTLFEAMLKYGKWFFRVGTKSIPVVGWILLAIDLIIVMYKKFEWFRNFVNSYLETLIEYYRMIWNWGNLIFNMVRAKVEDLWEDLKAVGAWLWDRISGIIDFIVAGIKTIWNVIKDSTVGKWLDEHIVSPILKFAGKIKEVIDKIFGVLSNIKDVFAPLRGLFTHGADFAAEQNAKLTKSRGWDDNGWYRTTENTGKSLAESLDYKNMFSAAPTPSFSGILNGYGADKTGLKTPEETTSDPVQNLLVDKTKDTTVTPPTNNGQQLILGGGAVVINVYNKDIDEVKLAKKVEQALNDIQRKQRVRAGN